MSTHTPGAIRAAEAITGETYGNPDGERTSTEYGEKTCTGIADLIDRETHALELLEALENIASYLEDEADMGGSTRAANKLRKARAAIAKAKGESV